jgi:very-short-patch-repair endonuclease
MESVEEWVLRAGGVASCDELRDAGYSLRDVDRSVSRDAVQRIRRGWVALPGAAPDVVAAIRAGGVLSCRSVIRLHGIWTGRDGAVHVRVPVFAHLPSVTPNGLVLHRTLRLAAAAPPCGGVDSISRAVAHAVLCQHRLDAIASLDSVLHRRLLSRHQVERMIGELPAVYRGYLALTDARAESGTETRVRLGLRAVNIGFRVQVHIDGVGRVDILVGDRLVIEADSREFHTKADDVIRDKRRDLAAAERGYIVLRVNYAHVMDEWPRVIAVVRAMVGRGEHRWAQRHRRDGLLQL